MARGGGTRSKAGAFGRGGSVGRRAGRNTTHQVPAYEDDSGDRPQVLMEPDATGIRPTDLEESDGYHQPTAMFDKGELLGELAELEAAESAPATRHQVEVADGPKGCRLIVVAGPDLGVEWAFKQAEITIGRAAENDLDFTDIAVSRNHARIEREGDGFVLIDAGSDNGTYLNGVRIEREPLCSGDEIVVGARTLRFVELTEAPPTAAAHPILDPPLEPVVGSPSEIAPALGREGRLGASQVDVGVIAGADEPGAGAGASGVVPAAPRKGTALKLVALGLGGLVLVAGLGVMAFQLYKRLTAEGEASRQQRARIEFLQGVELVKARRFGDALVLFDGVLALRPEYMRAKEYKAHAEQEIETWRSLQEAQQLVAQRRCDEGLNLLEKQPETSAWQPEIKAAARTCHRIMAEARLEEARILFEIGDRKAAMDVVQEALQEFPGLPAAIALRDRITGANQPKDEGTKPRAKPKTPPELEGAVALYADDRIAAAIDAAEAAGGPSAIRYIERMKQMQGLLSELAAAHKQKAAAEVIRLAPQALEIDQTIAHGEGEIRDRLREYYADALYLKGLEAHQDEDFSRAFQLLNQALKIRPGHRLSETRLNDLSAKAKELYYQGYVTKDTDVEETRRIFRRVTQMTRPSNQFHQWAEKWLNANGG